MEDKSFLLMTLSLGLLILQHVILALLFVKQSQTKKELLALQQKINAELQASNQDLVEVMSKFMKYLESEFDNNFNNQKKAQEWLEKNLDLVTQNMTKTNNSIEQTQRFLGRMSEALGIVQRSNLQDV
jgi:Skp family chaperone for outer membrane proteins